jgi:hypothetical protein
MSYTSLGFRYQFISRSEMTTFNAKTPLDSVESAGFLEIKPGDTYFRAGRHYHRPGELNGCVRDGNRCFLSGMVARRNAGRGQADRHLVLV